MVLMPHYSNIVFLSFLIKSNYMLHHLGKGKETERLSKTWISSSFHFRRGWE